MKKDSFYYAIGLGFGFVLSKAIWNKIHKPLPSDEEIIANSGINEITQGFFDDMRKKACEEFDSVVEDYKKKGDEQMLKYKMELEKAAYGVK